jgi:hypothetical protein
MNTTKSKREKRPSEHPRKGYVMLMHDSSECKGSDMPSTEAHFFEMTWEQFLDEIREDIDSFFGYPDGRPDDSDANALHYHVMWQTLKHEKEFEENGRRVLLACGTAVVK